MQVASHANHSSPDFFIPLTLNILLGITCDLQVECIAIVVKSGILVPIHVRTEQQVMASNYTKSQVSQLTIRKISLFLPHHQCGFVAKQSRHMVDDEGLPVAKCGMKD